MSTFRPPPECPVCGADVPRNARACPECGADERSGWNEEETRYDGIDLPDPADEQRDVPWSEKGETTPRRPATFWWIVGILLVGLLGYLALGGGW
ncbi:MAG TPA: zinc ribbon domain-containing protein [Opitutaceae bacterium]|nr:zinc ribbon domain-containing protein [Opitutaceae bacterium]